MVYIDSISLRNFQSYHGKEYTFNFSHGLNAISSPDNSAGKSTVFKSISVMANEKLVSKKSDRNSYISWGYSSSTVKFNFSDNTMAKFVLTEKGVVYSFTFADGSTIEDCKPIEETLTRIGLLIDSETGYIANMRDNEQGYLLLDTNSATNNNFIELILRNQYLDDMLNLADSKKESLEILLNKLVAKKMNFDYLANSMSYRDINALEEKSEVLNLSAPVFKVFMDSLGIVESLEDTNNDKPYDTILSSLDLVTSISKMINIIEDIKLEDKTKDYDLILDSISLAQNLNLINNSIKDIKEVVSDDIMKIRIDISNISKVIDEITPTKDNHNYDNITTALTIGEGIKKTLNCLNAIEEVNHNAEKVEEFIDVSYSLNQCILKIKESYNLTINLQKSKTIIEGYEEDLNIEGKEFSCGIHGKVIFKDGVCHPLNN